MNKALNIALEHWDYVAPLVAYPKNDQELDQLAARLDELLAIVGDDENHRLMGLVDVISHLITSYESEHYKIPPVKGIEALKFLMESNNTKQTDLSNIASQGVISEILRGKRSLNLRQIKLLAQYFHVDPSTFIDD